MIPYKGVVGLLLFLVLSSVAFAGVADAVVSVEAVDAGDPTKRDAGNGVCVSPGLVFTCHHVLRGRDKVTVTFPSRKRYRAEVIAWNEGNDVALVRFDADKNQPFCPLSDNDPKEGDAVTLIGDWSGADQPIRQGKRVAATKGTPFQFQTNITVGSGDSGGGIFDADGKLVSLTTGFWVSDPKHQGHGVETKVFRDILRLGKNKGE